MVIVRLIVFLTLFPLFLFSGEFVATVNRNQMNFGDNLTLSLTLKDASPKGIPLTGALKQSFFINSQHQSQNMVVMNGQINSNTTWKYGLTPHGDGEVTIPPISIDTSEGILTTQPITIQVSRGGSHEAKNPASDPVTATVDISNARPYKNEPFIYTLKIASVHNLADMQAQQLEIPDAIVEPQKEPRAYETVISGISMKVIELSYLITPLKPGSLKIPQILIKGAIPMPAQRHADFPFSMFGPFSHFGFEQLQPFTLATREMNLEVQASKPGINPWLPARSLKIEENWNDSNTLQEGEPFVRSFKIVGEGVLSSQLPNLADQQTGNSKYKIYADKPESGDEIVGDKIVGYRKEQFTIIPQQAGTVTLPEVAITWWDVTKNEKAIARLPARTLQVLPAPGSTKPNTVNQTPENAAVSNEPQAPSTITKDPMFYYIIGGMAVFIGLLMVLLLVVIIWGISLQKKIARLTEASHQPKKVTPKQEILDFSPPKEKLKKQKGEKLPDLNPT